MKKSKLGTVIVSIKSRLSAIYREMTLRCEKFHLIEKVATVNCFATVKCLSNPTGRARASNFLIETGQSRIYT